MKRIFPLLDSASLAALTLTMCSQLDVRRVGRDTLAEGLGFASKTFAIALSDVVFLLVLAWFVARCFQLRAWKRLWWPPLPCFALLFALILSALHSASLSQSIADAMGSGGFKARALLTKESKNALVEIAQWTLYFGVAPWLFVNLMSDRRGVDLVSRRTLALGSFALALVVSGLVALAQLSILKESAPRGLFGSPNVYGAVLALGLPLWLESEWDDVPSQIRAWVVGLSLIVFALATVASPWALGAAGAGLLAAALARRSPVKIKAFRLALVMALGAIAFGLWNVPGELRPYRDGFTRVASVSQKVKKQYVEWQAALGWNVPRERAFATGVGPDNYQLNIGPLYGSLPNEEKMPPDSNNLYLVQAVSIGLLGLGALLWVIGHFWALAWRAARTSSDWLGAGVIGALASWLVVNNFHALVVRGAGLILAWLFALAVVAAQDTARNAPPAQQV